MAKEQAIIVSKTFRKEADDFAQHILSIQYIGAPNPYPDSKDPNNTKVEPTADGLKM